MKITLKGDLSKTVRIIKKIGEASYDAALISAARQGVAALSAATPIQTGLTASSWDYRIEKTAQDVSIIWTNSNIQNGVPIAIILQYGHGTGTGGYVQGQDYINPAIKPVMSAIARDIQEVIRRG